jgi:putative transcriptional regulator
MARGEGPEQALVALGYAGWGGGQLEQELLDNAWLTAPANQAILFDLPPGQRWQAAAELLGVDLASLSSDSGHA